MVGHTNRAHRTLIYDQRCSRGVCGGTSSPGYGDGIGTSRSSNDWRRNRDAVASGATAAPGGFQQQEEKDASSRKRENHKLPTASGGEGEQSQKQKTEGAERH